MLHQPGDLIPKHEFRSMLDILYRISYSGQAPFELNSKRINDLVDMVYDALAPHPPPLNMGELKKILFDKDLFSDFWAGLFYEPEPTIRHAVEIPTAEETAKEAGKEQKGAD